MSTNQYTIPKESGVSADLSRIRLRYVAASQFSEEWNSALHSHSCAEIFFITGSMDTF